MKYTGIILLAANAFANEEKTIRELAEELKQSSVTWKTGLNKKWNPDAKPSDYAHMMGSLEIPEHMDLPPTQIKPLKDIPASFDPRTTWGDMCPSLLEIRDQGSCGSCWAFGASEALTDRTCIQSNGAITIDLSAEDILSCCKTCGFGCNGGYTAMSWSYFESTGIVTGGLYEGVGCRPYSIPPCEHHTTNTERENCEDMPEYPTPQCSKACTDGTTDYSGDKNLATSAYSVGNARNLDVIQTELMTNGPIEVSFTVYSDFMTYTGGVYYHQTGKSLGGHAVKMMGWGTDEESGLDYWLIANSWNNDWAEQGYFRIRRGTNECGIENSGYAGMTV